MDERVMGLKGRERGFEMTVVDVNNTGTNTIR